MSLWRIWFAHFVAETSKGFGFVEYEDAADAKEAMDNMDGTCIGLLLALIVMC